MDAQKHPAGVHTVTSSVAYFRKLGAQRDGDIPLAAASLMIAAPEYPNLDIPAYLAQLEDLGGEVALRIRDAESASEKCDTLVQFLSMNERFRGNIDDYYNPKNSFLNEVLDRKLGLPISLAVIYLEVGRSAGMRLEGVGLPGHFILRYGDLFVDPFYGVTLSMQEIEERVREATGEKRLDPVHLEPVGAKRILVRLLTNLKYLYIAREDFKRAFACCERSLALIPDSPGDLRDRGLLSLELEAFKGGIQDLERFLALYASDPSAEGIRDRLEQARQMVENFH
jgi:regulator of sirC expression with transglutaminase-like and TPR domain